MKEGNPRMYYDPERNVFVLESDTYGIYMNPSGEILFPVEDTRDYIDDEGEQDIRLQTSKDLGQTADSQSEHVIFEALTSKQQGSMFGHPENPQKGFGE